MISRKDVIAGKPDWQGCANNYARSFEVAVRRRVARYLAPLAHLMSRALSPDTGLKYRLVNYFETRRGKVEFYPAPPVADASGPRMILVNPDFSGGGAPQLLLDIARIFTDQGFELFLLTSEDGPLRPEFVSLGVPVFVDPDVRRNGSRIVELLGAKADVVIGNTILAGPAIRSLSPMMPCFWYIHEMSVMQDFFDRMPTLPEVFDLATEVWAGSELAAAEVRKFYEDVRVLPYGLDAVPTGTAIRRSGSPIRIVVLGSLEKRKGQDLAVIAMSLLPDALRPQVRLEMFGRTTEPSFRRELESLCVSLMSAGEVVIHGQLSRPEYLSVLNNCDVVLVSSRDDTLPLVSIDALSARRILICTATTGTASYLEDGVSGFVARQADASSLADAIARAVHARERWSEIAENGLKVFEENFSKTEFASKITDIVVTSLSRSA